MSLRDADSRHLAALAAVARERSFGRAAQRLGFTQSAVSQQIATLERLAGSALFDRPGGPKAVELTPAGRVVLVHAEAILGRLDAADNELARLRSGQTGRLVVGTFQSVSVKILPTAVGLMRASHPGVEVRLHEADENEELISRLLSGELDLSFVVGPIDDERVEVQQLMLDPFVVVMAAKPNAATDGYDCGPVLLTEILSQPLIGETQSSCQSLIELGLRGGGIEPNYVFRTDDNAAIQAMVRTGMGNAVRPLLAVETTDPAVVVRPIAPAMSPRAICVALVRGRTMIPAAAQFIELARQVCDDIVAQRDPALDVQLA